jgi:hypothetical protein
VVNVVAHAISPAAPLDFPGQHPSPPPGAAGRFGSILRLFARLGAPPPQRKRQVDAEDTGDRPQERDEAK